MLTIPLYLQRYGLFIVHIFLFFHVLLLFSWLCSYVCMGWKIYFQYTVKGFRFEALYKSHSRRHIYQKKDLDYINKHSMPFLENTRDISHYNTFECSAWLSVVKYLIKIACDWCHFTSLINYFAHCTIWCSWYRFE